MSEIQTLETPAGPAVLRRSRRRTLAISVLPDGSLELAAPEDAAEDAILAKVEKRSRWIATQRRAFREMNIAPPPRRYVSGATHRYLGRQYRLKVTMGESTSVILKGGFFQIATPNAEAAEVEAALKSWFRVRAKEQFQKRVASWADWCRKRRLPEPRLQLRQMPKRWGSASADGRIALNPELIHTPGPCIDYVIVHEICHLKHPAHDKAFFRQLSVLLPNWRTLKVRLEKTEFS
ncbi:M48 family metallopeptidase [Luteolibacter flavescens]|uniref:M48 family metallopeptidase n=1 Tax=Luteolibacter flavescens TaxID=1859460 RepID=A0ABT3FHN9_9BACT|nr:SprT family zinc-dependent metalloprotease [Luteolibacter flavescens]MCW1883097.1 M48 family metallopeptidase [Luteolibacter flavescens]